MAELYRYKAVWVNAAAASWLAELVNFPRIDKRATLGNIFLLPIIDALKECVHGTPGEQC